MARLPAMTVYVFPPASYLGRRAQQGAAVGELMQKKQGWGMKGWATTYSHTAPKRPCKHGTPPTTDGAAES